MERLPISSLYVLDINKPSSSSNFNNRNTHRKVMIREIEIGKDAMIYFICKQNIAESISRITENPVVLLTILIFHLIVVAMNTFYFVEPQGFISFDVVIVLSVISSMTIMLLLFSRASTSILLRLMKKQPINKHSDST